MTASNVVPFKQPVDERTYTLTLFDDRAAQNKRELTCTLDQLAYNIGIAKADDKAGLPWLKGALMGKQRSPKNSLRTNANVNTLTLLEGDYDANTAPVLLTMEDAGELIATEGLKALFYSSASDTTGGTALADHRAVSRAVQRHDGRIEGIPQRTARKD
jgi:hypothetical protein